MKTLIISTLLLFLTLTVYTSCGGNQNSGNQGNTVPFESMQAMQEHPGKKLYDQYCKACHLDKGQGIRGIQPPLAGTKTVNGDIDKLIQITLKGMSGKVVVDGVEYNGLMPPHTHLTNHQIADILTYVRQSFTNNASAITPEQVAKNR